MKIWQLDFELDQYENFISEEQMSISEIESFDGRSKKDNWVPIRVKKIGDGFLSNAPGFSSHIPVFDKETVKVLMPLIQQDVEILPLSYREGKYYVINITTVLDCIDYHTAEYRTFRDKKRIMAFQKYAFIASKVKNVNIFKIVEEPLRKPFVSDTFRETVIKNGLTGFRFKLVWDSNLI